MLEEYDNESINSNLFILHNFNLLNLEKLFRS